MFEGEGKSKLTHKVCHKEVLVTEIVIDVCPFLSKECFRGTPKLLHVPVYVIIEIIHAVACA